MLKNEERLQKILAADDIATQMLSPKDRELLTRFDEELDRLREEEMPAFCGESEEMLEARIDKIFRLVPGAERAIERHTEILDNLFKTGSG